MCEFCHRHGEGKKWYLAAANYSEELYRSRHPSEPSALAKLASRAPVLSAATAVNRATSRLAPRLVRWIDRRQRLDDHWGQVVPIEDALELVDMLDWVVRLRCVCRAETTGDQNARYCFGLGVAAVEEPLRRGFQESIGPSLSLETLTKEQAREALTDLDRRGAMHSVWTFKTPFIGAMCNCDRDCLALRYQLSDKNQWMFRAEYIAQVDPDKCSGCRLCMHQCLFGAMTHSLVQGKCAVNERSCYGCGLCRAVCKHEAITLHPRVSLPAIANLWGL